MRQLYSTRIWEFGPGQGDDGRARLEALQRIADSIVGAEICLYQDHGSAERYVTFGTWLDHQALQAFREHPEAERLLAELHVLLAGAYPIDRAITLEEVTR